jgi:hypothetical protein
MMASPNTFAAENAFVGVVRKQAVAGINRKIRGYRFESLGLHLEAKSRSNVLKLAIPILSTIRAVKGMTAEQEFKCGVSKSFDFGCVKMHDHAISDGFRASRNWCLSTFDFHETKTT